MGRPPFKRLFNLIVYLDVYHNLMLCFRPKEDLRHRLNQMEARREQEATRASVHQATKSAMARLRNKE